jgi:hypothetical protein
MMSSERPCTGLFAWLARMMRSLKIFLRLQNTALPQVLVIVEGPNDIAFLRRISAMLHRENANLPDLSAMEYQRALVFTPTGGVDLSSAFRFAGLNLPEFHLLDRDIPPVTQTRQQIAAAVNLRPRCQAYVTSKRSLESYLHSDAILEASGIGIPTRSRPPQQLAAMERLIGMEASVRKLCWQDSPPSKYEAEIPNLALDRPLAFRYLNGRQSVCHISRRTKLGHET